ncbi:LuxR C-terminal-related transcriptional regulator [Pseudonocardia sp. GCM10023141]|uniref:LuxR C-terminal-related transcriptional regulator n=1 Tax=Pseudonocardia sp. GCM10023141 TaxID=3252653 RepID=UPI00361AC6D3
MPGLWPLVGRAEELRLIGGPQRRHRGVLLAGAAGVGKTRLAREAVAVARRRGGKIHWVAATASSREMPLGVFAPLVGPLPVHGSVDVLRVATAAVRAGIGASQVVLAIDDGHLLDDLSAAVVHQLVLDTSTTVVMTVRSGEPTPDAVSALWRDGHLPRLELQPLSATETVNLLEAVLGGPLESTAARSLWRITGGNPLYLRHLVDGERDAGRLRPTGGVWRWHGDPQLSPGLTEIVRDRIGSLSGAEHDVLDLLALAEPVEVAALARLTEPGAVERAQSRRIVDVTREGGLLQARLAHPLYSEVRRADCGQLRARRLRGRLARELRGTGRDRTADLLRLAVLSIDSDLPADPELFSDAARAAAGLADIALAQQLAKAAIAAGGGFEPKLTLATVRVGLVLDVDPDAEFIDVAAAARTDEERVRAAVPHIGHLAFMVNRPADALAVLTAAHDTVADPLLRHELAAVRVAVAAIHGDRDAALELGNALLAEPGLSATAVTHLCYGLVVIHVLGGHAEAAGPLAARGVEAAGRSGNHAWLMTPITAWFLLGLQLSGELTRAAELAALGLLGPAGEPMAAASVSLAVGHVELSRGRVGTALRRIREAHAGMAGRGDAGGWGRVCLIDLVQALALAADPGSRAALAEMHAAPPSAFTAFDPAAALAAAWVDAADGAVTVAARGARGAAALAAHRRQPYDEVIALHEAVRFGDRTAAPRLRELAAQVDGPRAAAAARHAAAWAADDADGLLAASEELERIDALLPAADAAAQAVAVHVRHDRRGSAAAAVTRVQRLVAACEGGTTPAIIAALIPLPLSEREREVGTLAAAGLTNREIAGRLAVSVRTVEGHVYRVCRKLGVERGGLGAVLRG